ncbi:hypothetical protein GUJ93_ZPchr0007g3480 [Zizania palustris]|uniref:Uncharacterized protein n=1 Tax=Zizania palustris TaxID=103762 RepID=A0A8J5TDM9_ZIZPA|nr:hypothetical protein GUJ93_ZPchr0007g3480 [Zizania palustris]
MRSVHKRLYEARRADPPTLVQPPPSLVIAFASSVPLPLLLLLRSKWRLRRIPPVVASPNHPRPHVCRAVPFILRCIRLRCIRLRIWWECGSLSCNFSVLFVFISVRTGLSMHMNRYFEVSSNRCDIC